jgi:alpha-L-fucosidase
VIYEPSYESLSQHAVPQWFRDAKLGIFVHWSLSSVPAFAPVGPDPFELARTHGWAHAFSHSPYAEWYQNSLSIAGSPVADYHAANYSNGPYHEFGPAFVAASSGWNALRWGDLFAAAGARYCVMVTKHHDGFCLWPTETERPNWSSPRDLVGDCANAVRQAGLRFGVYYSGGLDWTFGGLPIDDFKAMITAIPQDDAYHAYADRHWRELMDRYQPDVLWNDIGYPRFGEGAAPLMADFYNDNPDGVVNDRFDLMGVASRKSHADFRTPEYSSDHEVGDAMFEVCRGIGTSFGFNRLEHEGTYLPSDDLIALFVDIVAHGGNLLLNVGPQPTGEIPWPQQMRLLALGQFLRVNGEAIYGTRPCERAAHGNIRFTQTATARYAIVLGSHRAAYVDLPDEPIPTAAYLIGHTTALRVTRQDTGIRVHLPAGPADSPAFALRLQR